MDELPTADDAQRPGGEVAHWVRAGALDDQLPELIDAINTRMAEIARLRTEQARSRLSVGARIVISSQAKPQYLRGQIGEVHEIDGDVAVVCLDTPVGRFTSGHVRCPVELVLPLVP